MEKLKLLLLWLRSCCADVGDAERRRLRVREWIKKREVCGVIENLLVELRIGNEKFYINFLRVTAEDFDALLERVSPLIKIKNTRMRDNAIM